MFPAVVSFTCVFNFMTVGENLVVETQNYSIEIISKDKAIGRPWHYLKEVTLLYTSKIELDSAFYDFNLSDPPNPP